MHSEKLMTWLRKFRRVSKTRAAVPQSPVFLARERKPHNNGFGDSSGWSWSRNMNCGFWGGGVGGGTGRHL